MGSHQESYRQLRQMVRKRGLDPLFTRPVELGRAASVDGYGIRTLVPGAGVAIKFEIIHEGRITLDTPSAGDEICGVRVLTRTDQVATTLLANGGWQPTGFLNVALEPDVWPEAGHSHQVGLAYYDKVGDVQRIEFADPHDVAGLLALPGVAAAARTLAVGLLRKGTSLFGRFHDYHLADAVFAAMPHSDPRIRFGGTT